MALQAHDHGEKRLVFIDALRVAAIVFVIIHHGSLAYAPVHGFWPLHDHVQCGWFIPFTTANAAFGMGLMFLLAGYFVPPSCDRKGPYLFLRTRWQRIGVPLTSFVLLLHVPVVYLFAGMPAPLLFLEGLYERGWEPVYLHLWFVAHLLLYCVAYTVLRQISELFGAAPRKVSLPGHVTIVVFIVVLALTTFLVRIWYPVDKWVPFVGIMSAEPAHLPQYIAFFAAGVLAYRGDWLRRMPKAAALIWLVIGMIASGGIYAVYGFGGWSELMADGGSGLSSFARSSWETVIGVGLSIGLIGAFRELFQRSNCLLKTMAAASFGAYILHPWIVVALQAAMMNLPLVALTKFTIVSVVGTVAAFLIAHLVGQMPGIRAVVGATSAMRWRT